MQNENHSRNRVQIHMVCNAGENREKEKRVRVLWKAYWMRNKSRVSYGKGI